MHRPGAARFTSLFLCHPEARSAQAQALENPGVAGVGSGLFRRRGGALALSSELGKGDPHAQVQEREGEAGYVPPAS